jgi:ribosomal protein S30
MDIKGNKEKECPRMKEIRKNEVKVTDLQSTKRIAVSNIVK